MICHFKNRGDKMNTMNKNTAQKALIADWRAWRKKKERGILTQMRAHATRAGMGGKFHVQSKLNFKLIF
jgi:hypothetical protein